VTDRTISKGVDGTDDRHDYFNERRMALAQRTQLILEAERGNSTVTPIRRGHLLVRGPSRSALNRSSRYSK
jgi:hypothetical protein